MSIINYILSAATAGFTADFFAALLLGALIAIDPCHLMGSIAIIAYAGKEAHLARETLLKGLFYALGRIFTYTAFAAAIYFGLISIGFLQPIIEVGEKAIGPILIIVGFIIAGVIFREKPDKEHEHAEAESCDHCGEHCQEDAGLIKKAKNSLLKKGYWGFFVLGILLSLALCPYIAAIFFGGLIPLAIQSKGGLILPAAFALGAGLPVILFSFIAAFNAKKINKIFEATEKIEKIMRYAAAAAFIIAGLFYIFL
ncbi:MAG: sulfite exporter TauE/SafE family protein [Candidatus Pacebacteria bacterium]|nr:sulfite exporter TauE/SafE family protein [Candidatus Paceibacterota bacterium]